MSTRIVAALVILAACGEGMEGEDVGVDAQVRNCVDTYDQFVDRNTDCTSHEVTGVPELMGPREVLNVYGECDASQQGRADCEPERAALVSCWESLTSDACAECVDEKEALRICVGIRP